MAVLKNPYTIKVDIRYLEHLLHSYKELKDIIYGKYRDDRDRFREIMKIHERNIYQLKGMLIEHKKENRV